VVDWTTADVSNWLIRLGLRQYEPSFSENDISGDVLVHLDHESLKELGVVAVGHRLQILKSVYNIKIAQGVPIEPGQWVPPLRKSAAIDDGLEGPISMQIMARNLEERDQRITQAEQEIKRLQESYARLREDVMPLFKFVKEFEPLPEVHATSSPAMSPPAAGASAASVRSSGVYAPRQSAPLSGVPSSVRHPSYRGSAALPTAPPAAPPAAPGLARAQSYKKFVLGPPPRGASERAQSAYVAPQSTSGFGHGHASGHTPSEKPIARLTNTSTPTDGPKSELIRNFALQTDAPCSQILPDVVRGHRVNADWRQFVLVLYYGGHERTLTMDERPLGLLKEYLKSGYADAQVFLRERNPSDQASELMTNTPGGLL
ncbi:uncharacterized protein V1510DRAFT_349375, partial [Dipodascopsis tothii]|uniref:uncharacterized protein n=1 Tax=Dipodascopsis tothii TaxID=44089 RepID=UPI0034CDDEA0